MIVGIRGTSGSGKSHLVRRLMALYETKEPVFVEGRKRPLMYRLEGKDPIDGVARKLTVLGHYETACGGCDTITEGYDRIFELIRQEDAAGRDVLFEGLLVTPEFNRTWKLHEDGLGVELIFLDVPLQECLDSVNARRHAKNPDKPDVNPKNTESKHHQSRKCYLKMKQSDMKVRWLDREAAFDAARIALGIAPW